jgi:hypothetical protein
MCDAIAESVGEPLSVVGKKDEEIILPEIVKKKPEYNFIQHKRFTRGNYTRSNFRRAQTESSTENKQ